MAVKLFLAVMFEVILRLLVILVVIPLMSVPLAAILVLIEMLSGNFEAVTDNGDDDNDVNSEE